MPRNRYRFNRQSDNAVILLAAVNDGKSLPVRRRVSKPLTAKVEAGVKFAAERRRQKAAAV